MFSIAISSIFIVLLYFFRKKIAFCNHYGLYTILGLYAVTFVRMALPFEFRFWFNNRFLQNFYCFVILVYRPNNKDYTYRNPYCENQVIEPKPELQAQLDSVAKQCKIKSMVKLRISDSISSPVTYGFIKPVVLFSNQTFTNEEFNFIATHECCHIKNKDIWIKLLTVVAPFIIVKCFCNTLVASEFKTKRKVFF